jgi:hypothetical protein
MSDAIILFQQDSLHVPVGLRELDEVDCKVVEVGGGCEDRPNIRGASVSHIELTALGLVELDSEAGGVQIVIELLDRDVVTRHGKIGNVQVVT